MFFLLLPATKERGENREEGQSDNARPLVRSMKESEWLRLRRAVIVSWVTDSSAPPGNQAATEQKDERRGAKRQGQPHHLARTRFRASRVNNHSGHATVHT